MSYLSYSKNFQGVADAFMRDPQRYVSLLQFIEGVMVGESEFTSAERELIAAYVSHLNGCSFCVGIHKSTLAAMGVDREAIDTGPDSTVLAEDMRQMLRFAEKLTNSPMDVDKDDIDALRTIGWPDQTIEDAINVVALFSYVNRLVDALGIKGNETYFQQVGVTLAKQGYAPLINSALKKAS